MGRWLATGGGTAIGGLIIGGLIEDGFPTPLDSSSISFPHWTLGGTHQVAPVQAMFMERRWPRSGRYSLPTNSSWLKK
jgi:hypothetical protein